MQLRLSQLRRVTEHTTEQERANEALKRELRRVLGPSFVTEGRLTDVAAAANECLDEIEFSQNVACLGVRVSPLLRVVDHPLAEVRRLAARLLPERFITKFCNDQDDAVRHAAAPRLPLKTLVEMTRKDPTDTMLKFVLKERRRSATVMTEVDDKKTKALNYAAKQDDDDIELSDMYYESLCQRLMQDYGRKLEFGWEVNAVRQLVRSVRATTGVILDGERLLKTLDKLCSDRDDAVLERPDAPIKEAVEWLKHRSVQETPTVIPLLGDEENDPVQSLAVAGDDEPAFMDGVTRLFAIKEATLPAAIRKFRLREGIKQQLTVPITGRLPHGRAPRAVDERVLDSYTRRWNENAAMQGEPVKLAWFPAADRVDGITFSAELR